MKSRSLILLFLYKILHLIFKYDNILNVIFITGDGMENENKKTINLNEINIDPQLKNKILEDIDLFEKKEEKAIYIYIKMCKLLTYDSEFFAVEQDDNYEVVRKHKNIANIKNITLKNNKVVCYDFNAIYLKLLNLIGINANLHFNTIQEYGKSHMYLSYKIDDYLIKADPVMSIIGGDIYNAKVNRNLKGLIFLNKEIDIQDKFYHIVLDVYKKLSNNQLIRKESIIDIEREYNIISILNLNIYEKLALLIDKVNKSNFVGIDSLSYLLDLRKILFTEEECDKNIRIVMIKNNDLSKVKPTAIIVINEDDLFDDYYDNEYYVYNPNSQLFFIDRVSLENKFQNNEYEYIGNTNLRIPCLITDKKSKIKKINR